MGSQQFCLKWNNHQPNMLSVFDELLRSESFVDVTLACDGLSLKAHKMVLSACSPYFKELFEQNPCQHPIVILKDVRYDDMKSIVDFMYKGEVNVSQEQLTVLLGTAETLKVKGLAEVADRTSGNAPTSDVVPTTAVATISSSSTAGHYETARGGRSTPPTPKRKKRQLGSLSSSVPSSSGGPLQRALASLRVPAIHFPSPLISSPATDVGEVAPSRDCDEEASFDWSRTDDVVDGGIGRRRTSVGANSLEPITSVKEEREEIEVDEPPDAVDNFVMDANPESIMTEAAGLDAEFNGSELESSMRGESNYADSFVQPFQSTPGTSAGHNSNFTEVKVEIDGSDQVFTQSAQPADSWRGDEAPTLPDLSFGDDAEYPSLSGPTPDGDWPVETHRVNTCGCSHFELPEFPFDLCETMRVRGSLSTFERRLIVRLLFYKLRSITLYPGSQLYSLAANTLVTTHPFLRDSSSTGFHSWLLSLKGYFKKARRTVQNDAIVQGMRKKYGLHSKSSQHSK